MSGPFVAEIRIFGFNFPPRGWAFCNGQLLPISVRTRRCSRCSARPMAATARAPSRCRTFRATRRCSRARARACRERFLGETGGSQNVTLLQSEIPFHTHNMMAFTQVPGDLFGPTAARHRHSRAIQQRRRLQHDGLESRS